ncbi:MAG: AraC family transcriptional regulator [Cyclobacteriaceae bacterium]
MLLKEFPDIHWLKNQIAKNFESRNGWNNEQLKNIGWPTVLLNVEVNHTERKDIKGPFSLFTNCAGSSTISLEAKQVSIEDNAYVVTNNEQHYDLLIDQPHKTETFNIHFGDIFCREAWDVLIRRDDALLDDPGVLNDSPNFHFRSLPRTEVFNTTIQALKKNYSNGDEAHNEEMLLALFTLICSQNSREVLLEKRISGIRPSTRHELLKRLYVGRDFIHSNYHQNITLDQISEVTYLSKFHFLRLFKQVFQVSPHQYIKRLQLQKAEELLLQTDLPVHAIATQLGFENSSSLSRLLRKATGRYPKTIRTEN